MVKKWSIKCLLSGILVILILTLSSQLISLNSNNQKELLASAEEMNVEEELIVSQPENNGEEVAADYITSQEAIEVIRKAYLKSVYTFNRDVDPSQSIGDGMYCRPLDKELSYEDILATFKGVYTEGFIQRSNIATKALKIYEGELYVLLLQGEYDYSSDFEVMSICSTKDTAKVRVKLITAYDTIEAETTLKKEEGTWKVEDGVIFPQLP